MAHGFVDRNRLWARLEAARSARPARCRSRSPWSTSTPSTPTRRTWSAAPPARRCGSRPSRCGCPALIERALATPGFRGVLCLHPRRGAVAARPAASPTTSWWPTRPSTAAPWSRWSPRRRPPPAITLMVDSREHLDLVDSVRASKAVPVRVAIDVDAGLRMAGQHVGPKRSPLYDTRDVVELARTVAGPAGLPAGGRDDLRGPGRRRPRRRARPARPVARRTTAEGGVARPAGRAPPRARRRARRRGRTLELWNAGGSGSVAESAADPVVTEVAAGLGAAGPGAVRPLPVLRAAARGVLRAARDPPAGARHRHRARWRASSPPGRRAPTGCRCRGHRRACT